jgi:hypothetical protein
LIGFDDVMLNDAGRQLAATDLRPAGSAATLAA